MSAVSTISLYSPIRHTACPKTLRTNEIDSVREEHTGERVRFFAPHAPKLVEVDSLVVGIENVKAVSLGRLYFGALVNTHLVFLNLHRHGVDDKLKRELNKERRKEKADGRHQLICVIEAKTKVEDEPVRAKEHIDKLGDDDSAETHREVRSETR